MKRFLNKWVAYLHPSHEFNIRIKQDSRHTGDRYPCESRWGWLKGVSLMLALLIGLAFLLHALIQWAIHRGLLVQK